MSWAPADRNHNHGKKTKEEGGGEDRNALWDSVMSARHGDRDNSNLWRCFWFVRERIMNM